MNWAESHVGLKAKKWKSFKKRVVTKWSTVYVQQQQMPCPLWASTFRISWPEAPARIAGRKKLSEVLRGKAFEGFKKIQGNLKINFKVQRQPMETHQNGGYVLPLAPPNQKMISFLLDQLERAKSQGTQVSREGFTRTFWTKGYCFSLVIFRYFQCKKLRAVHLVTCLRVPWVAG